MLALIRRRRNRPAQLDLSEYPGIDFTCAPIVEFIGQCHLIAFDIPWERADEWTLERSLAIRQADGVPSSASFRSS